MNEAAAIAILITAAVANTGLLTGVFFRLGGVTRGHEDHGRRIDRLESRLITMEYGTQ